jgi:hypothetical protein
VKDHYLKDWATTHCTDINEPRRCTVRRDEFVMQQGAGIVEPH